MVTGGAARLALGLSSDIGKRAEGGRDHTVHRENRAQREREREGAHRHTHIHSHPQALTLRGEQERERGRWV